MKVTPSNQTLILANEGPAGTPAQSALSEALSTGSSAGDSVLQRVTIVTAHPDSTMVYLQADYAAAGRSSADISPDSIVATIPAVTPLTYGPRLTAASVTAPGAITASATADGVDTTANRPSSGALVAPYSRSPTIAYASTSTRAVNLYASTQNILSDSGSAIHVHVDVHA